MAKFNSNTADNYGATGTSSFFSLKNDKDVATVRFMYNTLSDIEGYSVHEVEVDGKKRYVNCLREYNEPICDCPLCEAKYKLSAKLFVKIYDEDSKEVKVWDRGKNFFSKMSSLCARYNPLVSTVFEIERNGKPRDTKTTYETYMVETDNTTLEDLPDAPELLGTLILDKTYDELDYFVDHQCFPSEEKNSPDESNVRRRTTPVNNHTAGGRRESARDKF